MVQKSSVTFGYGSDNLGFMRSFFILTAALFGMAQTAMAQIVPHHAKYELHLVKIYSGMELTDLSGKADFTLKQSCDAWTLNHHADMVYSYSTGGGVASHNSYSGVEDMNGKNLEFFAKQVNNGRNQSIVRGHAAYNEETQSLDVVYKMDGQVVAKSLPGQFVYSVAHTQNIIDHAKRGDKFYKAKLYDGAEGDAFHFVNTVIGKAKSYDGGVEWPVSMAFFKGDTRAMVPEYEMRLMVREDGIVREMDIAYPDFVMRQTLVDVNLLEKPVCD